MVMLVVWTSVEVVSSSETAEAAVQPARSGSRSLCCMRSHAWRLDSTAPLALLWVATRQVAEYALAGSGWASKIAGLHSDMELWACLYPASTAQST